MAYDPRREDYQRLALRYAQSLPKGDPVAAARAFANFGRRFARDRDTLPQSDADRAFHLAAVAAEVIDYQLPFSSEARAESLISRGRDLLDEAISLDPNCHDAIRMRASRMNPTFDNQFAFLTEGADEVLASCEAARDAVPDDGDDERVALGRDIAMRPYRRWMAALRGGAHLRTPPRLHRGRGTSARAGPLRPGGRSLHACPCLCEAPGCSVA